MIMIGKLIILVFIELIILYISLRCLYLFYKKKENENENRFIQLEKRVGRMESKKVKK